MTIENSIISYHRVANNVKDILRILKKSKTKKWEYIILKSFSAVVNNITKYKNVLQPVVILRNVGMEDSRIEYDEPIRF